MRRSGHDSAGALGTGQPLQPVQDLGRRAVPVALPASAFASAGLSTVDLRQDG